MEFASSAASRADASRPALITQCSLGREDSSASLSKSEEDCLKAGMEGWQMFAGSDKCVFESGTEGSRQLLEISSTLQNMSISLRKMAESNAKLQREATKWKSKYEGLLRRDNTEECRTNTANDHFHDINVYRIKGATTQPEESSDSLFFRNSKQEYQKAPFRLLWGVNGDKPARHKHDVVSYESGNISAVTSSSKQITLVWDSAPRAVCIVTRPNSEPVHDVCKNIIRWLKEERNISIFVEPRVKNQLLEESTYFAFVQTWKDDQDIVFLHDKVDLVITLGGDGTVLWAASLFKGPVPPMVSFSMGSLGFLAGFQHEHYEEYLDYVIKGPLYITLRHRLQCDIIKSGEAEPSEVHLVLNEVSIDRAMSACLTNLDCFCDNEFVTSVQGDGLILSTTSGSTAYSLAAGGSMVHPHVPAILFTPICPHSLSFRPLILPGYVTVKVQVPDDSIGHAWASFDGKDRVQLSAGDALLCHTAYWPVPTASGEECTHHFLCSVRERLHWNLRKKQAN